MPKFKGEFEFKKHNLYFSSDETSFYPHKMKLLGYWRLNRQHRLEFVVDESQNKIFGKSIKFSVKVREVGGDYIDFSVLDRLTPSFRKIRRLYFKGRWELRNNKVRFVFKKDRKIEEITFHNKWVVSDINQLVYIYKRREDKKYVVDSFILGGIWKIRNNRFVYSVRGTSLSELDFSSSIIKVVGLSHKNMLELHFRKEFSNDKLVFRGVWKFVDNKALEFWFNDLAGRTKWRFLFRGKIQGNNKWFFVIKGKKKIESVGVGWIKRIFKDGKFFIEGGWGKEEKRINAGLSFRF